MWHFIKHFMTITRHRHKVMYHCLRCGILWQGMRHDLSKYSPTEFLPGARFYLGDRSPTEGERHEIGAFLGYPIHDIYGFINNRDEQCLLTGEWKVYADADNAKNVLQIYGLP